MLRAMTAVVLAVLLLAPVAGFSQHYGYYPYPNPYYGGGYSYGPQPSQPNARPAAPPGSQTPQRYYMWRPPDAATIQRWNQHNRMLDQEHLMRSPGNPEGPVEYMLRTF